MSKVIDLTGRRFGRLKVLSKAPSTGGQAEWICKCICGNVKKVKSGHLRSGLIQSCGCYNRERTSAVRTVNLQGMEFGKLKVIYYKGSKNGRAVWHCKCKCGNEIDVFSSYLKTGDTQSCGCIISQKEEYIEKLLIKYKANYKRQYTFPDLRGKMYPLRFDFAILDNYNKLLCLIEYQGAAHYKNIFKVPDNVYKEALHRDELKRIYCQKNNIKLYELNKNSNIDKEILTIINKENDCK